MTGELERLRRKYGSGQPGEVFDPELKRVASGIMQADGRRPAPYAGVSTLLNARYEPAPAQGNDYFPVAGNPVFDEVTFDQGRTEPVRYSYASNEQALTLDGNANNERYFVYNNTTRQLYQVSWTPSAGSTAGPLVETDTTNFTYDNYGNATTTTATRTDQASGSPYNGDSWTTTTTLTPYIDDPSYEASAQNAWCVGLVETRKIQYTGGPSGSTPVTRTQSSTANATDLAACRWTTLITEPAGGQYEVTEAFAYDAFGNVNTDTITGSNMSPRQTMLNWTATGATTGQFLMSRLDASGATTQYNYNFSLGLRISVTDPNLLMTSWNYDAFGRLLKETRPDQTYTQWAYSDCATQGGCLIGTHALEATQSVYNTDNTVQTDGTTWFDPLERPLLAKKRLLGSGVYDRNEVRYDNLGHVVQQYFPCTFSTVTTSCPYWTTSSYDALDRLTQSQRPISSTNATLQTTSNQYQDQNRKTVVTDANGHANTLVTDVNGWLRVILDANSYEITPGYDAAGSLNSVTDSLGNALFSASYAYGLGAFMTGSTDADLGTWGFIVDALGERTAWTDANGKSFSATYDVLSRPFTRTEPDLFTQWTWGTSAAAHEIGRLHGVCTGTGTTPTACTSATGYAESETYDGVGRLFQRSIQIPGDSTYTYQWAYNSTTELLDTLTYPTSTSGYALVLKYAYTNGLLQSITDTSDPQPIAFWTADATNPAGQMTQETMGNRIVVNHTFDAITGWPSSITAGVGGGAGLRNNSYLWDYVGNLTQRQDNNAGVTENVYPDSLNRLSNTVGDTNTNLTYDTMGRLSSWTANGGVPPNTNDYTTPQTGCSYYANAQPHAVRKVEYDPSQPNDYSSYCYDKNGNLVSILVKWPATYIWTSYNQPNSLSTLGSSSQFFYDHNHQRWKQIASYSGTTETTEYIGGLLEKMTNSSGTAYRYYVSAGNNFIAYNRWVSGNNAVYYVTRDHIGSSAVITDLNGALVVSEKFAALGWNENTSGQLATIASVTRHGFTGQEGLDNVGMVNMNGRVYNPSGTYFLSPDPYISDLTNTISYNRYAYVNYNPLRYTDPSGFCPYELPDDGTIGDDGLPCPEIIVPNNSPPGVAPFDWQPFPLPPSLVPVVPPALGNLTPPQIRFLGPETGPQEQSMWQLIKNWLCYAGNGLQTASAKGSAAGQAIETVGAVAATIGIAASGPEGGIPGATMMAIGGGTTLASSAAQFFGGGLQLGNDWPTGLQNMAAGGANLLIGGGSIGLNRAFSVPGNNYVARGYNDNLDTGFAFGGAGIDALTGLFPGMDPQQAACR